VRVVILLAAVMSWHGLAVAQKPVQVARSTAAAASYEISGTVINSSTGSGVARCHLTLEPMNAERPGGHHFPASAIGTETDDGGHFSLVVGAAGLWKVSAKARGFVSALYEEHGDFFSAVVVSAETPKVDIRFGLSPDASISGMVLDEAGEPVRSAQVSLEMIPPSRPGAVQPEARMRGQTRTDDRGMYELSGLSPGSYRVMVQAQPWYAAAAQSPHASGGETSTLDPSLDVAYPMTWFPGVGDPMLAETIVLQGGDRRQADFHLTPGPSVHLRILNATKNADGTKTAPGQVMPMVQQAGGTGRGAVSVTSRVDAQGQIDVGGLTPGLYEVRLVGPNQDGRTSLVEVTANATRTIDMNAPQSDMARVTIRIDGMEEVDDAGYGRNGFVGVRLIGTDGREETFSAVGNGGGGRSLARRGQRDGVERVVVVPPGRYEVALEGRQGVYITGMMAKGAEVAGRFVNVGAGESTLTVRVASGHASVSGVATMKGKATVGAMVLLVPITIEDVNSLALLREEQTNSDGSFELTDVMPGKYILLVVADGWQVNWSDASTLRSYLARGIAVDLAPNAKVMQDVTTLSP
jgi:Carboxypeptidase regulatory-like domain